MSLKKCKSKKGCGKTTVVLTTLKTSVWYSQAITRAVEQCSCIAGLWQQRLSPATRTKRGVIIQGFGLSQAPHFPAPALASLASCRKRANLSPWRLAFLHVQGFIFHTCNACCLVLFQLTLQAPQNQGTINETCRHLCAFQVALFKVHNGQGKELQSSTSATQGRQSKGHQER